MRLLKKRSLNGKYYSTFAEFQAAIQDCLNRINTDYRDDMKTLLTGNFQLFDNRTFLAA